MIQETIATGRDVSAAIDNGCQQLGIDREEDTFDFEIIAREKKGFLGLKTYPAKVRVFREVPDPKPVEKPKPAPAPAAAPKAAEKKPVQEKKPAREEEKKPAPVREAREPERPEEKREPKSPREKKEPRPQREKKPKEQKPREPRHDREQAASAEARQKRPSQIEVEPTDNVRERVERSAAYVEKILGIMGIGEVKVVPRYYEDNVCLQLSGAGLGVIIGRRGETLDAIQYLSSLVANRGEGDYIRVNIDSGNYREKRERTLEALARKLAGQAVRTGKSTTLEPMNPYERRVIHGAVAQVKGATSSSIGVDPNRRVVISAVGGSARYSDEGGRSGRGRDRSRDDRRREGGRGSRRDDRRGYRSSKGEETAEARPPRPKLDDGPAPERVYAPKKPAEPAAPPPKLVEFTQEEREVTEKTSLYGKIEL